MLVFVFVERASFGAKANEECGMVAEGAVVADELGGLTAQREIFPWDSSITKERSGR